MSELIGLAFLLITGPGFLVWGSWMLRSGAWRDGVPLGEIVIDRAIGIKPPPRNNWDRRFAKGQAWFLILFGSATILFYATLFVLDVVSE